MRKFIFALIALLTMNAGQLTGQANIAEARTFAQGAQVTITGIVTNGDELGPIRYIQDATAGLPVYHPSIASALQPGHEVTVTGVMGIFNTLIQIVDVTSHQILSTGNPLPEPAVVTPSQLNTVESQIVQINNAVFAQGGGTFSGNTTYTFTANGESSVVYIRNNHPLVGQSIPAGNAQLKGIASVFQGAPQVLPRGEEDISGNFVQDFRQSNITTSGFDISWTSNFSGSTNVRYGTTPDLDNEINLGGNTTEHTATLSGLSHTTFYYVQVYTEGDGWAYAESPLRLYSTASLSTGEIRLFFNNSVDVSVATGPHAVFKSGASTEAEIISFINAAQHTIDMCFYNINRAPIVNALNQAADRGVVVRYIANHGTANLALQGVTLNFPVFYVNTQALMHNKIMIVDRDLQNDSWVFTGSMNLTEQNMVEPNNVLFIQDQALAKAYTIEFEEMWGTSGPTPGIFASKVGSAKEDNTPHFFNIGNRFVELYFSPSDNTTAAILNTLNQAETDIHFALLSFTRFDLATAMITQINNGLTVRGMINNINDTGGQYYYMVDNGVDVTPYDHPGQLHHKYAIIDQGNPSGNPKVVTGSHNWSNAAENNNDENTLIIHDDVIANMFYQEWHARWLGMETGLNTTPFHQYLDLELTPNPATDQIALNMSSDRIARVDVHIFNAQGQRMASYRDVAIDGQSRQVIPVMDLPAGQYYVAAEFKGMYLTRPFVIVR